MKRRAFLKATVGVIAGLVGSRVVTPPLLLAKVPDEPFGALQPIIERATVLQEITPDSLFTRCLANLEHWETVCPGNKQRLLEYLFVERVNIPYDKAMRFLWRHGEAFLVPGADAGDDMGWHHHALAIAEVGKR